jgi:hypothetical protein
MRAFGPGGLPLMQKGLAVDGSRVARMIAVIARFVFLGFDIPKSLDW